MTTIRLKPKMVILAILAAATIGVAAFVAQGLLVRAGDFQSSDFQAGQMATSTSDASDSDILIATVGESSISLADLKEEKLHATYMETIAKRELDGSGPETGLPTKHLEAMYGVTTKWGVETASLAKLIQDLALFEKAKELGLTATKDEIAENQKFAKEAYDNGEYDDYNKGYVESVGEDTYWKDVYPRKAKLALSISKLRGYWCSLKWGIRDSDDLKSLSSKPFGQMPDALAPGPPPYSAACAQRTTSLPSYSMAIHRHLRSTAPYT